MSNITAPVAPVSERHRDGVWPAEADHVQISPAISERRGLRRAHLWVAVPLCFAWFATGIDFIEPYDFWWNVKSGQIMAQTGRFLATDVLVWTPVREPYFNPQWGAQLLFFWAYNLSPYLLLTLRTVIITAVMGALIWLCGRRSGSLKIASVVTLIAFFTGWTNYGMRPQLLAFLPFMAYLVLLERKDTHPRHLLLLMPLMVLWVNIHGSYFLGVALLGIYAVGTLIEKLPDRQGRRWLWSREAGWQALCMAGAVAASLLNPYMADIYRYFFIATNDPIARALNSEWQAPTFYNGTGLLFYANAFIFLTSVYLGKRRMRPTEILLVLAFSYLALVSLRNVIWWAWVTAPIMAANFANLTASRTRPSEPAGPADVPRQMEVPALNRAILLVLAGCALAFTPLWREVNPVVPTTARTALDPSTPTGIAQFLKGSGVPAPLFNYMEWGGYLEWELYPAYQMFVDGRFEARRVQVWDDYLSVSRGRADWQQTLDHYGVRTLVLNKQFHRDLIPFVSASPAWRKVYEDKMGVIYVRE